MKKVTAIVRVGLVGQIVGEIKHAGFRCLTVINVSGLGDLHDPGNEHISFEYEGCYTRMSRVEILCSDGDVERVVHIVKSHGHTDRPGDGIVFVSSVERAVNISSGEDGEPVLTRNLKTGTVVHDGGGVNTSSSARSSHMGC